jgi:REP element-mobilizing transposase RayT
MNALAFKLRGDESSLRRRSGVCQQDAGVLLMNDLTPKGWTHRGYLPHFDGGSVSQFITCRLADSLPQRILERWRMELKAKPIENIDREILVLIEKFLDKGYGECYLKQPQVAEITKNSLLKFDGERYKLLAWVIMPNHIHLLLRPINDWSLSKILHSFKSFTASEANKVLGREGRFWMREYFDRYIRDAELFEKAFRYIENNPVKAGLCEKPSDWKYSSAFGMPSS